MSVKEAWSELYKRGWSLLPSRADASKAPCVLWTEYQKQRASLDTMRGWLKLWPNANPGVITGRVSNLIVLDQDGIQGAHALLKMGVIPMTPKVKTGRGAHYYFRYPQIAEKQRVITKAGVLEGLDSRGDGGFVVGPGSVHYTGAIYEWEVSPEECDFADAPQWWLDLVVSNEPDPLLDDRPLYTPESPRDASDRRARSYVVAALKGEVETVAASPDGTKHDALLKAAYKLGGYVPYLAEGEIEQALYDAVAFRAADKRAARKTIRDGIQHGILRPRPIPESAYGKEDGQGARQGEKPAEPTTEQRDRWEPIALPDLVAPDDKTDWLWRGYLAPRIVTLFTGLWKSGKSTLLGHILKSFQDDSGEFVGQPVTPCKVLVVSEESARLWVTRRGELSLGGHVYVICKPFMANPDNSGWRALLEHVKQEVAAHSFDLVVFDSLPNLWAVKNENDNAEVKGAITDMSVITEAGAALLLIGHHSKTPQGEFKATRGAGALMGQVDVIMEYNRFKPDDDNDTRRIIRATGRFEETPRELVLDFDGFGYTALGTRSDAARMARKSVLWDILPLAEPGMTLQEIHADWPEEPKPPKSVLGHDLQYLAREGIEVLASGNPARYRRSLTNQQWQQGA